MTQSLSANSSGSFLYGNHYEDGFTKNGAGSAPELRKDIVQIDECIIDGVDIVDNGTHAGKDVGNVAERFADVQDSRPCVIIRTALKITQLFFRDCCVSSGHFDGIGIHKNRPLLFQFVSCRMPTRR